MITRTLLLAGLAGVLLLGYACDNGTDVAVPAALEKLAGDAATDTAGQTLADPLTVRVVDEAGNPVAGMAVSWSPGAGSVDPSRTSTAEDGKASTEWTLDTAAGEQTVTADADGVAPVTFTATAVPGAPATVELDPDTLRIRALQDTVEITAVATDAFGNAVDPSALRWSTTDTAVVGVDAAGQVWSEAVGEVEVSAAAGVVNDTVVVVVAQVVETVSIFPDSVAVSPGGVVQFNPSAADSNGFDVTGAVFTWSSSDTTVAVVSEGIGGNGYATTRNSGTTTISATSQGVSGSAPLVVVAPGDPVELTVRPDSALLTAIGDSTRFDVLAVDSAGYRVPAPSVTWSSTDTAVVKVDSTGLATAAGDGSAHVVARANGATDSATVVVDQSVATIGISPAEVVLTATGDAVQLWAEATDVNGYTIADPDLQWSSGSPAVSVDISGYIVAQESGSTTVTAEADGASTSITVDVRTTSGVARSWIGGDPADSIGWLNPRNWAPAGVVNGQDTASVAATTTHMPAVLSDPALLRLVVEPGAMIRLLGHTLTVHGDVVADGEIGSGQLILDGTGTLSGSIPNLWLSGTVALTGETTARGVVRVAGGAIDFDGHVLRIRP